MWSGKGGRKFLGVDCGGSRLDPGPPGSPSPVRPLGAAPVPAGAPRGQRPGSVQPQVRVGRRPLVSHITDGVLQRGQAAARRDAHGLDHLLSATREQTQACSRQHGNRRVPQQSPEAAELPLRTPLEAGTALAIKPPAQGAPLGFPGTGSVLRPVLCGLGLPEESQRCHQHFSLSNTP